MVLNPGARLGPYEITAQIGEGGMGEVYRAIDTNLKRPVAIKVVPASVASDKDHLARFQREAEVLASLNPGHLDPRLDTRRYADALYLRRGRGLELGVVAGWPQSRLQCRTAESTRSLPETLRRFSRRRTRVGRRRKQIHHQLVDGWPVSLYTTGGGGSPTSTDVWVLPLTEERKPLPFVQSPFSDGIGRFSPDERWVAYHSNESGKFEIYVVPFPMAGGKWLISLDGGMLPRWRRDGKELFYVNENVVMAAEVNGAGPAFQVGPVRRLFEVQRRTESTAAGFGAGSVCDVSPDGQRFLVNVVAEEDAALPPQITVITNWTSALR